MIPVSNVLYIFVEFLCSFARTLVCSISASILLLMQAVEERKSMVVAVQLELQAALRRAARQEALTEAAEGQLNTLREENNEVSAATLPRTSRVLYTTAYPKSVVCHSIL